MQNLNELAKEIHAGNVARGFYKVQPTLKTQLMLVITELSEAVEADRKGKYARRSNFEIAMRTGRDFQDYFNHFIKDSFEDEIADAFIRLMDIAGNRGVDLSNFALIKRDIHDVADFTQSKCDIIFDMVHGVSYITNSHYGIHEMIQCIDMACKVWNIDREFHVTEKLKYNATRPYKHGKNY